MDPAQAPHESMPAPRSAPRSTSKRSVASKGLSRSHSVAPVASRLIPSLKTTSSVRLVPQAKEEHGAPTEKPSTEPTEYQVSKTIKVSASIKRRADGRAQVPSRFRDSFNKFFFSTAGVLKIIRMGLIAAAVVIFMRGHVHEVFVAITIQETCIVLFFIVIYLLTLQHMLICLHWPLLDLINSLISAIFLSTVSIMTIQEKGRRHLLYVGGTLCLTAAVLCLFDAILVTKAMRINSKKAKEMQNNPSWSSSSRRKLP